MYSKDVVSRRVVRAALAALVLTAGGTTLSYANDDATVYDLGEVLVTANRVAEKKIDVPADTTVITANDIAKENYSTVSDALKANNVPVVQKGFASYPELNGDTRVLVMVNGRRMNWEHLIVSGDNNAIDIDQFPVENIERIEVVKGPNSSLYGERAVAGVINIITKQGIEGQQTTVRGEVGTWGYRKASIATQGGDENNAYFVTYSKQKQKNYEYKDANGNKHVFPESSIDRDAFTARFDHYYAEDHLSLDFSYSHRNDGFGIYLSDPLTGTAYGSGMKSKTIDTSYGATYYFGEGNDTFVRTYRNTERANAPFAGTPYTHDLGLFGLEGQKTWKLGDHTLIGGATFNHETIDETNDGVSFDKSATTKAAYAEDKWDLGNGWTANLGTRYEHHNIFGGDWASHVGINKKLDDRTHVYASWGQAVNNPTLKMLYANSPYWLGNPDLKPEKSYTYTIGADSQINDRLNVSASIYESHLKDALDWVWDTSISKTVYYNVNREKRQGLNLSATYKLDDAWKVKGYYNYLRQRVDEGSGMTNDDKNRHPNTYGVELSYEKNRWSVTNTFQYVTGRSTAYYTDSKFFTWDMNVNYKLNEATKVYVQGFNLTDEAYEVEPYNYPVGAYAMPGRHFVAGVEHKF